MPVLASWCAGLAALLLLPTGGSLIRLGAERQDPSTSSALVTRRSLTSLWPRTVLCLLALGTFGWALVGPLGLSLAMPGAILLSRWIGRLEPVAVVRARSEIRRDLPLALDLLAACSIVGRPPQQSLPIVSRALGGALGDRLGQVCAHLLLGADPVGEWGRLAHDRLLGDLGRALMRSAESGAPLGDALARLAEDRRRDRRIETQIKARNVGVRVAGPLAGCFLPAFVLVGVVPTVAGSFLRMFG